MRGIGQIDKQIHKKKKKKKKKKAKQSSFLLVIARFIWRMIKTPALLASIGLVGFFMFIKHNGDYDKIRLSLAQVLELSQNKSNMVLQNILLDGHKYTPKEEIIAAVTGSDATGGVQIGYPLMRMDLWQVKARLEKLTWIKHAAVTRQFPSTLSISMVERQPMALWQNKGKISLIDSDGEVINERNLQQFSNLIILVGDDIPYHAGHFLKFISTTPEIANMISSGTFISGRHWNVQLKNGILIKLPEDNPEKAWAYLTKKQKDSKILESNIKTIDLRIEQKMFVK